LRLVDLCSPLEYGHTYMLTTDYPDVIGIIGENKASPITRCQTEKLPKCELV